MRVFFLGDFFLRLGNVLCGRGFSIVPSVELKKGYI